MSESGEGLESSRPRRTERAHRGKPDFYSPSDYENPFRRQRKRTVSSEAEQKKKKGRPKGSFKTLRFDAPKKDDYSSGDDDENSESPEVFKDETIRTRTSTRSASPDILPTPTTTRRRVTSGPPATGQDDEDSNISESKTISPTSEDVKSHLKQQQHLHLCMSPKDMTLIKDKGDGVGVGGGEQNGKDSGKEGNKQTDLYSTLTPEKTLQCAIILAEINRKFACQNFKPV